MKTSIKLVGLILLLLAVGMVTLAQENPPDRAVVSFSNAAKPGTLRVELIGGSILVRGYDGKEVIIEARWREKLLTEEQRDLLEPPEPPEPQVAGQQQGEEEQAKEKDRAEKAKGLKPIQVESSGLVVEEEENVIRVETESWKRAADLTIQVPYSTSLHLECHTGGAITVERVDGEIVVENSSGAINLNNVSGPVVADTEEGEIRAIFGKVNPSKPMSFSTMNGDIDITLPFDVKSSLKMKTEQGKIFTDFDVKLTPSQQKKEDDQRKEGGGYRVSFEKTTLGLINGGGVEIQLNTYEGSIFIRKSK